MQFVPWDQTSRLQPPYYHANGLVSRLLQTLLCKHLSSPLCLLCVCACVCQIQRALLRNNQTQRFSQKQAIRLHQGLVTSTAEQVSARDCLRAHCEVVTVRVVHTLCACARPGDGAPVCAGAAAGVFAEGLRGRRGRSDGQADP